GDKVDQAYLTAAQESVLDPSVFEKSSLKVVFSPIHGTGASGSIPLLEKMGVDVVKVEEQMVQDPRFPSVKSPNPENAEALTLAIRKAEQTCADIVMATDPDADRMGVAVRNDAGSLTLLTGNMIGSLLAAYRIERMKEFGLLPAAGTSNAAL